MLLIAASAYGQSPKRIALTPNTTVSTGEVLGQMKDQCPGIALTLDGEHADFLLEIGKDHKGNNRGFTLFSPGGDVVFHTAAFNPKHTMKDVCSFIAAAK